MEGTSQPAISSTPMQLLPVGHNDDFRYLRDLLSRTGDGQLGLHHAHATEEAPLRLSESTYDLLLCEYKAEDGAALRLLHELRRNHPGAPVIFLSDHMDETAVEMALKQGGEDFAAIFIADKPAIPGTIRSAIDSYRKERQHQKAENTLRKLWRAVEQTADLVMITDREGMIEYVNPAFEAASGYSPGELIGKTPRVLKSGQQNSELYTELWQTILSGNVLSLHGGESQKERGRLRRRENHHSSA